jgi:predicted DNA-binding transcriptional regulator YafY
MSFTASSEPELISWVLSFGDEAKLLKPDWLVDDVKKAVNRMQVAYSGST